MVTREDVATAMEQYQAELQWMRYKEERRRRRILKWRQLRDKILRYR